MDIKESKQVIAYYGNNKRKIIFTVPLDFVVTEEYTADKIKNRYRTEAEEWLKRKGFIEEPKGWSFYGDGNTDIKFPTSIACEKTQRLHVKFHRIEGVKYLKIPIAYSRKIREFNYTSLNEFPNYIEAKYITLHGLTDSENDAYEYFIDNKTLLDSPLEIDDHYFCYLVKNNLLDINKVDLNRFQEDVLKLYDEKMYNVLISAKGLNKFKL